MLGTSMQNWIKKIDSVGSGGADASRFSQQRRIEGPNDDSVILDAY